jgi:hypothetical protein
MEERSKLSGIIHAWRESVRADTILQREPAKFDWFRKHLVLRPLLKTQQGHMVVLLKVRSCRPISTLTSDTQLHDIFF